MPFAGEPHRGLAIVRTQDSGLGIRQTFTLSVDNVVPDTVVGDQATWEGTPGSSVTLRLERQDVGAVAVNAETFEVRAKVPGGADVGATVWSGSVPASGDAGVSTRTLTFAADPLNASPGVARAGTIELYLLLIRTTVTAFTVDSRGATTGAPLAGNNSARGYLRARSMLSSFAVSNVALGGAEPASLAYPDSTFNRLALDAVLFRAEPVTAEHRAAGSSFRTATDAASTAVQRDYSWAATSGATGRVNKDYPTGPTGARAILPARDFGGDNETAWAATGHATGFTLVDSGASGSANRTLDSASRIASAPALTLTGHLQVNDNVFAISKAVAGGVRQTSDLGFVAARIRNSRGEGVNLPGDATNGQLEYSLQDAAGLTTASVLTTAVVTRDSQAGWGALLSWSAVLPGGAWADTVTVRDAAGAEGTAALALTLLAKDPRVEVIPLGRMAGGAGDHFTPGDTLVVTLEVKSGAATADAATITNQTCSLVRHNVTTGLREHYDGSAWVATGAGSATALAMTVTAIDPNLWTRTFASTSDWGIFQIVLLGSVSINGTPYSNTIRVIVAGDKNRHSRQAFDPVGMSM